MRKRQSIHQLEKLSQKGIEVIGYTDHSTSMDVAVRRAVTSGINQSSLKFKMDNCKELGLISSRHQVMVVLDHPIRNGKASCFIFILL